MKFRLVIEINATGRSAAEELREDIIGTIEDNEESGIVDAEAWVNELEELKAYD